MTGNEYEIRGALLIGWLPDPRKAREYLTLEAQRRLADRLARIEGHVRSIRRMVVDHRCADEILIQIAAVKAELNQTAAALIDSEI
ncbi:MAG: metal-sensing transcriptional repressor [Acidobacteria bacterium]|nr:metal-sensing transcriptional repressor [Acidobacteriota bacterium]